MYYFTRIGAKGGAVPVFWFLLHTMCEAWGLLASYPGRGLGTRLSPKEQRSVYLYWIDNNLQLLHVYPHRPGHEESPVRGSGRFASSYAWNHAS